MGEVCRVRRLHRVVGNWKLNPMRADALQLIEEFKALLEQQSIFSEYCHIGVAPTAIALTAVKAQLNGATEKFIPLLKTFLE